MADKQVSKVVFGEDCLIDLTQDTVEAEHLLTGKTTHHRSGQIIEGAMPDNADCSGTISDKDVPYEIPLGYHNGNGVVTISQEEKDKLIPENIRLGVQILGVPGQHIGDLNYVHEQTVAAKTWTVNHNLDKYPAVTIVDSAETVILGDVHYVDFNTLTISFSAPFTGKVFCN